MFEKDVLPQIGTLAVEDVKKAHITALLLKIKERGVKRQVNVMLSLTRQMFLFAIDNELIEADPTATLKKKNFGGKEAERERCLEEKEIKELRDKLPAAELPVVTEASLWIMLATLCRVGELSKAATKDLQLDELRWRIPPENSKNGKEHIIALSSFAAAQFQTILDVQTKQNEEQGKSKELVWVLPNRADTNHLDEKTITKQVHDRQRTEPLKNRSSKVGTLILSGGTWTPHDLRRSGATLMGELGVDGDVVERCLNHIEPSKIRKTYQRQKTEAAKAEAWRLLGERLELLTQTDTDNVVLLTEHKTAA